MLFPAIPLDEDKRVQALKEYSILDTLPEEEYEDITYLASQICGTPISLISLLDEKRQWFKSHLGLNATETPKEIAFCAHAIHDKENIFIIEDSRTDHRFFDNPLVTDDPHVIFYAGVPLVNPQGFPLGTLCVIDNKPHHLNPSQIKALKALTHQLMKVLELRKISLEIKNRMYEIEIQNKGLEKFARTAAHDIKSPLSSIIMLTDIFKSNYGSHLDQEGINLLDMISMSSKKLNALIDGILNYSKNAKLLSKDKELIDLTSIVQEVISLLNSNSEVKFTLHITPLSTIYTNKTALTQVFINLISNSIKYNNKEVTAIEITALDLPTELQITIADNGPGIPFDDRERIFQIFETTSNIPRSGENGHGIGLATVKSLVEGLGGEISVNTSVETGAMFLIKLKK